MSAIDSDVWMHWVCLFMSDYQIKLSAAFNTVASSLRHLLLRLNSIESIEDSKKQMLHDIQLTNTYIYTGMHLPSPIL